MVISSDTGLTSKDKDSGEIFFCLGAIATSVGYIITGVTGASVHQSCDNLPEVSLMLFWLHLEPLGFINLKVLVFLFEAELSSPNHCSLNFSLLLINCLPKLLC